MPEAEATVSNNKLHIPLIIVFGAIFTLQGSMFLFFYNWSSSIQTESNQAISKMQADITQYKATIDLRVSLAEEQLRATKEMLSEMKADLKEIKRATVRQ